MSDPTLGLTYDDFRIRVAEYLGIAYYGASADQAAQLPIDAHDVDLVSRVVNDGYRRFIGENERWNFLTVPLSVQFVTQYSGSATGGSTTTMVDSSIAGKYADSAFNGFGLRVTHASGSVDVYSVSGYTGATGTFTFVAGVAVVAADTYELAGPTAVEGQNFRYYLPDDFGGLLIQDFTYGTPGPRIGLNMVDEAQIRELYVGANTSGTPSAVTFRPVNTAATSTGKRWELLVWPKPTGTETIYARYKRFPNKLTNGTDRSVAGFQHDDAILMAAFAAAELQRGDSISVREAAYQAALKRSFKVDARSTSTRSRDFGDRSEDRAVLGNRPLNYYGVSTYNGNGLN